MPNIKTKTLLYMKIHFNKNTFFEIYWARILAREKFLSQTQVCAGGRGEGRHGRTVPAAGLLLVVLVGVIPDFRGPRRRQPLDRLSSG